MAAITGAGGTENLPSTLLVANNATIAFAAISWYYYANVRRRKIPCQVTFTKPPHPARPTLARPGNRYERISSFLTSGNSDLSIRIQNDEKLSADIILPASVLRLLKGILAEMAQGHGVALLPVQAEVTTQQAADLLNVSRPYLIRLLEDRKIPFRLVGQHRRVRVDDLLVYQRKDDEERRRVADELTADAQALVMGY